MAMRLKRLLSISRRLEEDQLEGIAAGARTWHWGPVLLRNDDVKIVLVCRGKRHDGMDGSGKPG
jgi:hypothetical protein